MSTNFRLGVARFSLAAFALLATLVFAACGDDEDEAATTEAAAATTEAAAATTEAAAATSEAAPATTEEAAASTDATDAAPATTTAAPADPIQIGASFPNFTPFYVAMFDNVKKAAAEGGGGALEPAINNHDAAKQITDITNLLTAGANALFVVPADSKALGTAMDAAKSANVPVVVVDDVVESEGVFMNVKADNRLMAELACKEMGDRLGGEGKVLSLEGDQATANGRDRTEGFAECMSANYPNIEVIGRPTEWSTEKGAAAAQTVLTANPDLGGIYMQSDTLFLAPILQLLEQSGKTAKVGEEGHVVLVGIDGTPQALAAIREKQVDAIISQPIEDYGRFGVFYLEAARRGETFAEGPTDHGSTIVATANGTLTDYLPSPVVTADNVDDPALWGNAAAEG